MSPLADCIQGSAEFSEDEVYRYALRRWWDDGDGACLFIMLNPSTATAEENDPTIRRCIGYAQDWGYQELIVANLFALRSTDPKALLDHPEPIGPENDQWINELYGEAKVAVGAWGALPFAQIRGREIIDGYPDLHCLGTTAKGSPKHPLYLKKDLTPVAIKAGER